MDINASKKEFKKLKYFKPTDKFNGVIIIPTKELHDTGFRCMKFALTKYDTVVGCVGGFSDVIHLNGIGGYGKYSNFSFVKTLREDKTKRIAWCIDCLPNGLLRLFCSNELEIDDLICSDFCLYVKE